MTELHSHNEPLGFCVLPTLPGARAGNGLPHAR